MEEVSEILDIADEQWRYGRLPEARQAYARAVALDPYSQHAKAQLAHIDTGLVALGGTLDDWAWETVRVTCGTDAQAWEVRAAQAADAQQWGLAAACYEEAAELAPGTWFDPPASVQRLPALVAQHLERVRAG